MHIFVQMNCSCSVTRCKLLRPQGSYKPSRPGWCQHEGPAARAAHSPHCVGRCAKCTLWYQPDQSYSCKHAHLPAWQEEQGSRSDGLREMAVRGIAARHALDGLSECRSWNITGFCQGIAVVRHKRAAGGSMGGSSRVRSTHLPSCLF